MASKEVIQIKDKLGTFRSKVRDGSIDERMQALADALDAIQAYLEKVDSKINPN